MGAARLGRSLGISIEEAKDKVEQYMKTYPAVRRFMQEAVSETLKTGYAFTVLGRRRNIPQIASRMYSERAEGERLAVNMPIQGSAADVCRTAQVLLDNCGLEEELGCRQLMNVHDELVWECPKENVPMAMFIVKQIMPNPFSKQLPCPMGVDGAAGPSWGNAK